PQASEERRRRALRQNSGHLLSTDAIHPIHRSLGRWRRRSQARPRPRYALAIAGGGVIGGMSEVGALTALEERLNGSGAGFDIYVGCSAGSRGSALAAMHIR